MREILSEVGRWIEDGERRIAVATVVATYGSAPRGVGGKLAIGERGQIAGSVSGGCIESEIIERGLRLAPDGLPEVLHFETSDERAWEVGLPCGGSIDVLLEPLDLEHFAFLRRRIEANERVFSVTRMDGGGKLSFDASGESLGEIAAGDAPTGRLVGLAAANESPARIEEIEGVELFVESFPRAPTLLIVGGVHIAIALVRIAKVLGFITVIVDPRRTFGNAERFPEVDRLLSEWPEEAFEEVGLEADTAVAVLTHDPKLDDPALQSALRSPAFYIGALGSARTQERRRERLAALGFSAAELSRIRGPVGLEIGASTPEEIALSIAGEIVALTRGVAPLERRNAPRGRT